MPHPPIAVPLGIDISKASFDVALLSSSHKAKHLHCSNDTAGFEQLCQWLQQQGIEQVHACLEATSVYSHDLALHLYEAGHPVSIVNPLRIHGYGKSQLNRTKTDRADAKLIAQFCRDLKPALWQPAPEAVQQLQAYTRRLEALEQMLTQEKNRQLIAPSEDLAADIEAHPAFLEGQRETLKKRLCDYIQAHESLSQQHDCLVSITGVGTLTAARVLSEIGRVEQFSSARQLAAFAGLTPQQRESGTSVKGRTRLCKLGNHRLRKALYFPALSMIRHCQPIQQFRDRLLAAGKYKMQVVGAVMHKLIRIIYGVLKSQKPFDPKMIMNHA